MTTLLIAAFAFAIGCILGKWFGASEPQPPMTFPCECGHRLSGNTAFCPTCGAANIYNPSLAVGYTVQNGKPVRTGGAIYAGGRRVNLDGNLRRIT